MKQFLMAVLLFSSLTACKKDDDNKKSECVLNEAAVIGVYSLTSVTYQETSTSTPIDQLPDAEPCERDDSYHFKTNGVFQLVDDGVICDGSSTEDGTWSVSGNNIVLEGESLPVKKFDCHQLILEVHDSFTTGDVMTLTFTKH